MYRERYILNFFFPLGPCVPNSKHFYPEIPFPCSTTWMAITLDTSDCTQAKDNFFWTLYIALSVSFITLWLKHLHQGWGAIISERTYKRSLEFWMIHPCHVIENKFSGRKVHDSRNIYEWQNLRGFDLQN